MRSRSNRATCSGIILGLLLGVACLGQTTTAPAPAAGLTSSAPASQPALDPEVDRILTRLGEREVQDLHARLTWRQDFVIDEPEDAATKKGEIWYQRAKPVARFLISFSERLGPGGRVDKWDEKHLFDGCWYVEVQSRTKTFTRREVRRPDDPGDPYKVGQGVFPLPFGQKKEDILREFDVRRLPPTESDPPNTDHLKLVPRAGTRTGQSYKELDFWVDREGPNAGLPTRVRVAKIDGTGKLNSHITITFGDAELNLGLADSIFDLKVPEGYQVTEEALEEIGAHGGATK